MDRLPEIVLDGAGAGVRDERDPLPESRFGDRRIAELGGVLDQRLELACIVATADERQDLGVGRLDLARLLRLGGLLVALLACHDCPFAVAIAPARPVAAS